MSCLHTWPCPLPFVGVQRQVVDLQLPPHTKMTENFVQSRQEDLRLLNLRRTLVQLIRVEGLELDNLGFLSVVLGLGIFPNFFKERPEEAGLFDSLFLLLQDFGDLLPEL